MYDHPPGGEILGDGLRDLRDGVRSVNSLLVLIGALRLTRCGIRLPLHEATSDLPEHELYRLLTAQFGSEAYRHYRSLLRRLVSLENTLDNQMPSDVVSAT
jgi:hypothetical protein